MQIRAWSMQHPLLVSIFSGFLIGGAFLIPQVWWVALVGVVLMSAVLPHATRWWWAGWYGWIAWLPIYGCAISWFWSTYPLDWFAPLPPWQQLLAIGLIWVVCTVSLAAGGFVYGSYVYIAARHWRHWRWGIPGVWVVAQAVGALVFSIVSIGPSVAPNIAFSFGHVGYLLSEHSLFIYLAQFGGVYLLGVVFVLIAVSGWWLSEQMLTRTQQLIFVMVVLGLLGVGYVPLATPIAPEYGYRVAIVDTQYRTKEERNEARTKALRDAVKAALAAEATHVVLPEDARFTTGFGSKEAAAQWFQFQRGLATTTLLDTSTVSIGDAQLAVRGFLYDGVRQTEYVLDKRYLVPQGEFVPYLAALFLDTIGRTDLRERADQQMAYRQSDEQDVVADGVPGVMFCFESVMPYAAWQLTRERTEVPFIMHPISHGWFHSPWALWPQLDQMLRVQAVWGGVPIVSAANLAVGKSYYPNGLITTPTMVASSSRWQVGIFEL